MISIHFSIIPAEITRNIRMNGSTKRVYESLALYRRQDNGECWMSQTKLARDLGYARKTICLAIKNLIKLKLIAFINKWKHGRYKFYKVFRSVADGLKHDAKQFTSRVTSRLLHMKPKSNNISDHDYNTKEKFISRDHFNGINDKQAAFLKQKFKLNKNIGLNQKNILFKDVLDCVFRSLKTEIKS